MSNETTFNQDIADREALLGHLWHMSEKVSGRMKAKGLAGRVVTLKLRRADFSALSRQMTLEEPSQLADTLFREGRALLAGVHEAGPFRLIGIGYSVLAPADGRDPVGDLLDPQAPRRAGAERAADAIRARFGPDAIRTGRGLGQKKP